MRLLKSTLLSLFAGFAFASIHSYATTLTIDLVSESGTAPGRVMFTGNGAVGSPFGFVPANDGFDFLIAGSSDPSLVGLKGNISGTFQIGSITTLGATQTAAVTSTGGVFSIFDGVNQLSADLDLLSIGTLGTGLGLNLDGLPNLKNFSYAGSNASLLALATSPDATVVLSAQFQPKKSLLDLTAKGAVNAAVYSGTIAATVPEPSNYVSLTAGLLAAALFMRRRRLD